MKMTGLTFVIASMLALPMHAFAQDAAGPSEWALKNVKLGASPADVRAAFPDIECKTFADPAIESCSMPTTLADKPGVFRVKFLNGGAVYVAIERVTYEQAMEGAHALTQKFGAPTKQTRVKVYMHRPGSGSMRLVERPVWGEGNVQMYVKVADETDTREDFTYSAVVLIDQKQHNSDWVVRYDRKGKPPAGDI